MQPWALCDEKQLMAWRVPFLKNQDAVQRCAEENSERDREDVKAWGSVDPDTINRWALGFHGTPLENIQSILLGNLQGSVREAGDRTLTGRDGVYCYPDELKHKCVQYSTFRNLVDGYPRAVAVVLELMVDRAYRVSNSGLPVTESPADLQARLERESKMTPADVAERRKKASAKTDQWDDHRDWNSRGPGRLVCGDFGRPPSPL